ncbi:uncharacterized protein LOC143032368 isoform X4 [Oratosquilla oratoria]|uniref:uncharacterized protein LOC143032368 isoform X4 n=1 Tax=Oratosquilla oratoria TaxID=337810 RepID=UPI003F773E94
MLSSCWFATPFTGCFSSSAAQARALNNTGGLGSGMSGGGESAGRVRVSQSEERSRRLLQPSHRSRSEGPIGRDNDDDNFLVSEYKTQYAWVRRPNYASGRGPEAAPLLQAEKPPPTTTSHVLSNGVPPAGGGHSDHDTTGVSNDPPAAGQQQQRTPRKSKSMGRIHGGGNGAPPAAAAPADGGTHGNDKPAAGLPQAQQQAQPQQQQQQPPDHQLPPHVPPSKHVRGHRRVPSDGVTLRHSKGGEGEGPKDRSNMLEFDDDRVLRRAYKSEYRKKFRPFSQYQYVDGKFHKVKTDESDSGNTWYKEVLELRRQAGQYRAKHDIGDVWKTVQYRGWGVETASERLTEIYNKQAELWEQVSRRSSLQALSLAAATPRPITKEEKDQENSRRSSPLKHSAAATSKDRPATAPPKPKPAAPPAHSQKSTDKPDGKTSKESTPRHHYDRTTGVGETGLLITSPSRDKIEPIILDDSSRRSSRRTPPITSPSKAGRSISVGAENRSPKRTSRPPSTHQTTPSTKAERRPRPTSLSTSARSRGVGSAHHRPSSSSHDEPKKSVKKPHDPTASPKKGEDKNRAEKKTVSEEEKKGKDVPTKDGPKEIIPKDGPKEHVDAVKESSGRKSTPEPRFDPEKYEPVVKTPPEPTRVKSPDQVMVKSPDPVNWTVPLDTGKTFTVTHNIPEATHCLRIPRGESARGTPSSEYRHLLEQRTRQTPEPTKLSQGSLAGTPASASSASSSTATAPAVPPPDTKQEMAKPSAPAPAPPPSSSATTTTPSFTTSPSKPETIPEAKSETESKPDSIKRSSPEIRAKEEPNVPTSVASKPTTAVDTTPAPLQEPAAVHSGAADPMTMSMFGTLNGMNGKSSGTPSPTKPEVSLPSCQPKKEAPADSWAPSSHAPANTTPATTATTATSSSSAPSQESGVGGRSLPGTNLRCLDDPSFLFEKPSVPTTTSTPPTVAATTTSTAPTSTNSPKPAAYKVLEAPVEPPKPSGGGYRVLEAPEAPSDIKDLPDQSPTRPENPIKPSPYRVLEAPIDPPARPKGSPYRVLEAPDAPYYPQVQAVGSAPESKPPSLVSPSSGRTVTDALDKARTRFDSFWGGPKDKDPPGKV